MQVGQTLVSMHESICFLKMCAFVEIDANNPPSFTEEFKVAVRSLHDITVETRPYRLIVVKAGPREFNTTLNTTTEGRFDSAFSEFIRELSKIYIS